MAYDSSNLTLMSQVHGPVGMKIWVYDTTDATGTIDTAGYISNAGDIGMEKGDVVYVRIWTSAIPATTSAKLTAAATAAVLSAMGQYVVMGISTAGAADLAATTALTVTNSD